VSQKVYGLTDHDVFCREIRAGANVAHAATVVGFAAATIYKAMSQMPELWEQYQEAKKVAKELREDMRAEAIRSMLLHRALDTEDPKSAELLRKAADLWLAEAKQTAAKAAGEEDSRSDQIAEAIDRFTSLVGSLAAGGRAELPPGDADGRGESAPRLPVGGVDSKT